MTILAGIISRKGGEPIPHQTREVLRRLLSRDKRDVVKECGADDWILAKVDIGAFGSPAVCDDADHAASMLAGEPLLLSATGSHASTSRAVDLKALHIAVGAGEWSVFASATGTFCGAHFERTSRTLSLFTDKIGLRPIYYWSNERFVVFASAMRILEGLSDVPKRMDLRGVTEIACFGFPLADRTAYDGIKTLRAGEIVRFSADTTESVEYWRWDRLAPRTLTGSALAQEAHRRFISGVARRVDDSRVEVAFLSGGLDSRTIVAALRSLAVEVHSINFAPPHTQDEVFARQAAQALGTTHHYLRKEADSISDKGQVYNQSAVSAWFDAGPFDTSVTVPRRVWSGDGGSVAVGHVYLSPKIIELAQGGATEAAIDEFCRYNTLEISPKLFHPEVSEFVTSTPKRGLRDELARLECPDRGRAFHLFLMFNDQRRHLFDFYENIDLGRLEFRLPFFDSHFLELILPSPIDDFLGHRFYMEWLKSFAADVTSVPWQAYRGHVPCPLPIPQELGYQWSQYYDRATRQRMKAAVLEQARGLLASSGFPGRIIDRLRLRAATWATQLGIRDYGYAIRTAAVYARYWRICEAPVPNERPLD